MCLLRWEFFYLKNVWWFIVLLKCVVMCVVSFFWYFCWMILFNVCWKWFIVCFLLVLCSFGILFLCGSLRLGCVLCRFLSVLMLRLLWCLRMSGRWFIFGWSLKGLNRYYYLFVLFVIWCVVVRWFWGGCIILEWMFFLLFVWCRICGLWFVLRVLVLVGLVFFMKMRWRWYLVFWCMCRLLFGFVLVMLIGFILSWNWFLRVGDSGFFLRNWYLRRVGWMR